MIALASLTYSGCGGGGGGGSSTVQIAPGTLDNIELNIDNGAFVLKFFKLAGVNGNESGGVSYTPTASSFRVAEAANGVGRTVKIPGSGALNELKYTYLRNSANTATLSITWTSNSQVYPHSTVATATNPLVLDANLFWGGRAPEGVAQTTLELGILFTETSGNINATSTITFDYYTDYKSTFVNTGPATTTFSNVKFDYNDARFTLNGRQVPAGYATNPDPTTPSGAVWESLVSPSKRNVIFTGLSATRAIRHDSKPVGSPVIIPSLTSGTVENGTILVDSSIGSVVEITDGGGEFAYVRTGGKKAKYSIRYNNNKVIHYELVFTSTTSGTFTDSEGDSGTFMQDTFTIY